MSLTNFYQETTKKFSVTISYNGSAPDITGDTVKVIFKKNKTDSDASAVLTKTADVTTNGLNGQADFTLTPTDTNITAQEYWYEILWILSTGEEYVLENGTVSVYDRLFD